MLDVLYLDNHLLVINKPPGLLVQGDRTGDPDALSLGKAYLKERFDKPGNVFLGLVHRLDRPTSGVVVFARTSKAASRLSDAFRRRAVEKRYLALVEGRCSGETRLVDMLRPEGEGVRVVPAGAKGGKKSVLEASLVAASEAVTLLDITLETGRKHQIRAQLAHHGHPIVGDLRYGARRTFDGRNLALHAYALRLDHPTRQERMTWQAAPPEAWYRLAAMPPAATTFLLGLRDASSHASTR